ncbi:hypothetical protein ACFONG_01960 [Uliginosibacterium paludis]|uniref:Uncharacterized protein n=1 Tax=Uliginosibacterium paludis TaxID=1615952 RepID=A0ABV2CSR8_9RHOO
MKLPLQAAVPPVLLAVLEAELVAADDAARLLDALPGVLAEVEERAALLATDACALLAETACAASPPPLPPPPHATISPAASRAGIHAFIMKLPGNCGLCGPDRAHCPCLQRQIRYRRAQRAAAPDIRFSGLD